MLKLTDEQREDASRLIGETLGALEVSEVFNPYARGVHILGALAEVFDVSPVDPGPDNDVAEGNVWPRESDAALAERAFKLPAAFPRTWH